MTDRARTRARVFSSISVECRRVGAAQPCPRHRRGQPGTVAASSSTKHREDRVGDLVATSGSLTGSSRGWSSGRPAGCRARKAASSRPPGRASARSTSTKLEGCQVEFENEVPPEASKSPITLEKRRVAMRSLLISRWPASSRWNQTTWCSGSRRRPWIPHHRHRLRTSARYHCRRGARGVPARHLLDTPSASARSSTCPTMTLWPGMVYPRVPSAYGWRTPPMIAASWRLARRS